MEKRDIMQFIFNNDKLEVLKAKINKFNPLKILKVQDYEIRHSNVLAWILDPEGNHNFGDRFLKRFLVTVLLNPENEQAKEVGEVYQFQKMIFTNTKIHREWKNIDLLVVSDCNKLVILIENKVYSNEHSNQLQKYLKVVQEEYQGYTVLPVLLSLEGYAPSDSHYLIASYQELLEIMEFIILNYTDRTSTEVISFLNYYIAILKEKYVMDEELRKLIREVYFENKDVIDLLYSVGNENSLDDVIARFVESNPKIEIGYQSPRNISFIHEDFKKSKYMGSGWASGYPVSYWVNASEARLKLILEIGSFDVAQKRIDFLNYLGESGIKIYDRAKDISRKFSRIYTETILVKDWADKDEVFEKLMKLYSKNELKTIEKKVIDVIENFDWGY